MPRMMSGKHRNKKHLLEIEERYYKHCKEQNYPEQIAKEVWRQIESFAGYSFSKAHSASYAVESFQSLYLKAHYPLEFMVAVINNFGGFYNTRVYVNEAKISGANILLPCINKGHYLTSIDGKDIYLGFVHIKSLEASIGRQIENERNRGGVYLGLEDFVKRMDIGIEQLVILIRIDSFRFTGRDKRQLLWEAHLLKNAQNLNSKNEELFSSPQKKFQLPTLVYNKIEDAYDELQLLGFPVSMSYFELLKTSYLGECTAVELMKNVGKEIVCWLHFNCGVMSTAAGLISLHRSISHYISEENRPKT